MACQSHGKMDNMNSVNHVIFIVDTSRSMRKNDAVTPGADKAVSRIEAVRRELHRFCMHQQASKLYNRDLYSIWLFEETRRCVVSCVDVGVATEAVNTLEITPQSGTSYQAGELYLQMPKRCLSLYLGVQCTAVLYALSAVSISSCLFMRYEGTKSNTRCGIFILMDYGSRVTTRDLTQWP